ncbi:MAG: tRNA methyltransferase [Anaerolineae bacterium]|nr:tRNA methyltransferase [Anaerolineae bacterium]
MQPLHGTPLKRFLREQRRAYKPPRTTAVLLSDVAYPINVGSIFRIADACDVRDLVLCGVTPAPPNPKIEKVARYKDHRIPWRYVKEATEAIADLKAQGYHICALEITDQSAPYYVFDYPAKLCVVVGNEDSGVKRAVLAACDSSVFLPMYGKGRSLNVHVSVGVLLYHVLHLDAMET